MSFQTVYNVELECQSCVDSVKSALQHVEGIERFDIDLTNQRVSIEGTTPISTIVKSIQSTGRDAIIRGTGLPNSAAVSILEQYTPNDQVSPVKGLARIVSTGNNNGDSGKSKLLVDITLNGLEKGIYYPSLRSSGNLSKGAESTGDLIYELPPIRVEEKSNDELYSGQSFASVNLQIHELIGRGFVISDEKDKIGKNSIAGVIARSAGIWENDKQVCSCSGKNIWQERQDANKLGLKI